MKLEKDREEQRWSAHLYRYIFWENSRLYRPFECDLCSEAVFL